MVVGTNSGSSRGETSSSPGSSSQVTFTEGASRTCTSPVLSSRDSTDGYRANTNCSRPTNPPWSMCRYYLVVIGSQCWRSKNAIWTQRAAVGRSRTRTGTFSISTRRTSSCRPSDRSQRSCDRSRAGSIITGRCMASLPRSKHRRTRGWGRALCSGFRCFCRRANRRRSGRCESTATSYGNANSDWHATVESRIEGPSVEASWRNRRTQWRRMLHIWSTISISNRRKTPNTRRHPRWRYHTNSLRMSIHQPCRLRRLREMR